MTTAEAKLYIRNILYPNNEHRISVLGELEVLDTIIDMIPTNGGSSGGGSSEGGGTVSVTVIDNLLSTLTTAALSANQGKVIKGLIDGKAPLSHSHAQSEISGLSSALSGKANATHTHNMSEISGLNTKITEIETTIGDINTTLETIIG